LDSNDDFFTGRDRVKELLEVEDDEVGEDSLCPSNRVGLETGDSVITPPNRGGLFESFEGGMSQVSFVEADDVREWG
jgi:hypothetical protein